MNWKKVFHSIDDSLLLTLSLTSVAGERFSFRFTSRWKGGGEGERGRRGVVTLFLREASRASFR